MAETKLKSQSIETDAINAPSTSHLTLTPGTSKLVKVAVLRQDNTTNSYENNTIVLTGWGWALCNTSNAYFSESVTFGITFDDRPIVVTSSPGYKASTDPTHIGDFTHNSGSNQFVGSPQGIATTGFTAVMRNMAGTSADTLRLGYTWIAIGELA